MRISSAPVAAQSASVRTADTPPSGTSQHASTDTTAVHTMAVMVCMAVKYSDALVKSTTASSASRRGTPTDDARIPALVRMRGELPGRMRGTCGAG